MVYFEIVKTKGKQKWHARIRDSGNHKILFWTEDYEHKSDAKHACELVKDGAASADIPSQSIKENDDSPVIA